MTRCCRLTSPVLSASKVVETSSTVEPKNEAGTGSSFVLAASLATILTNGRLAMADPAILTLCARFAATAPRNQQLTGVIATGGPVRYASRNIIGANSNRFRRKHDGSDDFPIRRRRTSS